MINPKYLPSKKFLTALSIAVVVVLIAIILNYWIPNITSYKSGDLATNTSASSSLTSNVDSDKDGLPDWLENLYGTDPKKADTDGDGTSDFDEIKANRDPLKANTAPVGQEPNDKIDPQIIANNQKISDEYQNLNSTQKMARDLMSNIIASQPVNGQMDQATIDALVDKSISDLPQKQFSGITKESDLNLISTDKKTLANNLLTYAKNYYVQTELFRKMMGQDLQIVNDSISVNKAPNKEKLLIIIGKYQDIINSLIKMPLPATSDSSGAICHLSIINSLEKLISIDNDIIKSSKSATDLFSDLAEYNDTMNDIILALSTMDTFLKIQRQ